MIRAANDPSVFTITEKAPTRTFSWLKAPTSGNRCVHPGESPSRDLLRNCENRCSSTTWYYIECRSNAASLHVQVCSGHSGHRRPPRDRTRGQGGGRRWGVATIYLSTHLLQGVPKKMLFSGKTAITTFKLIQNAKVGGVLENSGYLLSDGHWDFQNWRRNDWENEA